MTNPQTCEGSFLASPEGKEVLAEYPPGPDRDREIAKGIELMHSAGACAAPAG